jgi:hypothetical protein
MKFTVFTVLLVVVIAFLSLTGCIPFAMQAEWVRRLSYWTVVGNYILLGFTLWLLFKDRLRVDFIRSLLRLHTPALLLLFVCAGVQWRSHPFEFKILADEHLIAASAKRLHEARLYEVPDQYHQLGQQQVLMQHVDKRPPAFSVLVASVHDMFGFSFKTPIYVNALLLPVFLLLAYALAVRFWGKIAGLFTLLLIGSLPLAGSVFVSGALLPLTCVLILVCAHLALSFMKGPSQTAYAALLFAFCLLAQSRYEAVLFVPLLAFPLLSRWGRPKDWPHLLHAPLAVASALLLVRVWHHSAFRLNPKLWQSDASPFALSFVQGNLTDLQLYLFSFSSDSSNSVLLGLVGVLGCVAMAVRAARGRVGFLSTEGRSVFIALLCGTLMLLSLLLAYSWPIAGPMTVRLLLPIWLLLALCGGWFLATLYTAVGRIGKRVVVWVIVAVVLGVLLPRLSLAQYEKLSPQQTDFIEIKRYLDRTRESAGYRTFVADHTAFYYLLGENVTDTKLFNVKPDLIAEYMKLKIAGPIFFPLHLGFNHSVGEFAGYEDFTRINSDYYQMKDYKVLRYAPDRAVVIQQVEAVDAPEFADLTEINALPPERRFRVLVP